MNRKGFTLVELLATIIILGILFSFALPTIFNMLDKSKKKIYISDAEKLISLVEYKLRSSSTSIEKPNNHYCMVMSLNYLKTNELATSPNKGKYDKDKSYVVLENDNNNLKYYVTLVENKGGYQGLFLVEESALKEKDIYTQVQKIKRLEKARDFTSEFCTDGYNKCNCEAGINYYTE